MKILEFSDIHVDINATDQELFYNSLTKFLKEQQNIDVVICAGDVSPDLEELEKLLNVFHTTVKANYYVFVPGNHDVWDIKNKIDNDVSRRKYEKELPLSVVKTGFHYLPGNPIIIENSIAVFGNIGWYDYTLRNKKWDNYLKEKKTWYWAKTFDGAVWNDAVYAEWGMHDLDVIQYLLQQLEKDYEKIKDTRYKILILHHIPFAEGVEFKDTIQWDYFSAFMGSEEFGKKILNWKPDILAYGHTHRPHEYEKEGIKVYCSPLGYKTDWETNDLNELFKQRIKVINFEVIY